MEGITRRSFLAAAGISAIPAVIAHADEARAVRDGDPGKWDYEADVVVVGFGGAGIGAAIQAAGAGCSVIVLEKMEEKLAGGDTTCNDGSWLEGTYGVLSSSSCRDR